MAESAAFSRPMAHRRRVRTAARAFARVDVYCAVEAGVLEAWADLERVAPCSIYQTRAWLLPWLETLGRKAGLAPLFVVARGTDGAPLLMLALGMDRTGPVRLATFLGGRDSNFNLALVRPGVTWSAADLRAVLRDAAQALGTAAPDGFRLVNQPLAWSGVANPLARLGGQPSPSAAFGLPLDAPASTVFDRKLSKDTRKKLRKKEARLAALGPVTHRIAADAADRDAILATFLAQKCARFRDQAIVSDFADDAMRAFIEKAATPGADGTGIELHALYAGPHIVAVYGGAAHGGRWSGMFNSFASDPEIARSSPGDLLLMHVIASAAAAGLSALDLGIGEARYKATFCDETIPLRDSFVAVTAKGWLVLTTQALALRLKRAVKRNAGAFALAKRLRAIGVRRRVHEA